MPGVYVLNDPHTQLIKIGRATDLDDRLANLRTGNPRLALIEWFETPEASLVETYVHNKLAEHRREGEFFDVPEDMALQEVRDILALLADRPHRDAIETIRTIEELEEDREPDAEEVILLEQIVALRARIKTLQTEDEILTERLMVMVGKSKGLLGWASFNGSSTNRFESRRFQSEHPDLARDYMKTSYSRTLRIRRGMAQD
jgi:FKBP-type peptidyl-prolyl cis-trans isomerase (trigger factor)